MKREPLMNRGQRAAQVWSVLAFAARNRQILTYGLLAKLIGVPTAALGQLLEPIQAWCLREKLPPLTVLVVSESSGMPGAGFIGAADVPAAQMQVFLHDWLADSPPTPEQFESALNESGSTRNV